MELAEKEKIQLEKYIKELVTHALKQVKKGEISLKEKIFIFSGDFTNPKETTFLLNLEDIIIQENFELGISMMNKNYSPYAIGKREFVKNVLRLSTNELREICNKIINEMRMKEISDKQIKYYNSLSKKFPVIDEIETEKMPSDYIIFSLILNKMIYLSKGEYHVIN